MGLSKNHAAGENRVGTQGLTRMDGCGQNDGRYPRDDGTSCRKVLSNSDGIVTRISETFPIADQVRLLALRSLSNDDGNCNAMIRIS